jgi:hypothetical protein
MSKKFKRLHSRHNRFKVTAKEFVLIEIFMVWPHVVALQAIEMYKVVQM